jgi:hypothetical protein
MLPTDSFLTARLGTALALVCSLALLCACAANKKAGPALPEPEEVEGAVETDGTPKEVSDRVSAGLVGGAFVIEAAAQDPATLVVRYRGAPETYIDCGQFSSVFKTRSGQRKYTFAEASALQRYEVAMGPRVFNVERKLSLEADATLRFVALAGARTRVLMETRYRVDREQVLRSSSNSIISQNTIGFTGKTKASFPDSQNECRATERFEAELLAAIGTTPPRR